MRSGFRRPCIRAGAKGCGGTEAGARVRDARTWRSGVFGGGSQPRVRCTRAPGDAPAAKSLPRTSRKRFNTGGWTPAF